jgi:hypothetical protein
VGIVGIVGALGTGCAGSGDSGDDSTKGQTDSGGSTPEAATGSDAASPGVDGGGGGVEAGGAETGAVTPQPTAPNGYYVSGSTIYDTNNMPHLFLGVDRPSLEWDPSGQALGGSPGIPASDFTNMAAWNANVVRLSLNQDFWLVGAALYNSGYQATVQAAVTAAEAAGLDVILDLHWSDQGNLGVGTVGGNNGTAGNSTQQPMADMNSVTFWTQVATLFKGDGHVLFELYNEPFNITPQVWLSGGTPMGANYTAVGMQTLYDTVRATGALNLVLIGGTTWAYDLTPVLSGMGVVGTNIVYVAHPYGQNSNAVNSTQWDQYFGPVTSIAPVMATEFGDTSECAGTFDQSLIPYLTAHNMSWSAYAWWSAGSGDCSFPTLLSGLPATASAAGQVVCTALNPANASGLCAQ